MSEYAERFAENGIDVSVLRHLTDQDLKDIGVLLGHRRKVLAAIAELTDAVPAAPHPTLAEPRSYEVAERRPIAVMFCDLVGSTTISAALDAEDWRNLVSAYLDAASEAVKQMGGRVAKTEVTSGSHLLAERYDRDLTDVFEIQDEVTQAITATLVGQLGRSQADRARRTPTLNWKAYDYVLQGVACTNRYQPEQAEVFLHSAIKLDPDYAQAHAMLAAAYQVEYLDSLKDETLAASFASAQKAVLLDADNPYGHAHMGLALLFLGKINEAEAHLDRAILLNPHSVWCLGARAIWLNRVGRTQEALAT